MEGNWLDEDTDLKSAGRNCFGGSSPSPSAINYAFVAQWYSSRFVIDHFLVQVGAKAPIQFLISSPAKDTLCIQRIWVKV